MHRDARPEAPQFQGFDLPHKLSGLHFRKEAAGTSRVGSDGHRSHGDAHKKQSNRTGYPTEPVTQPWRYSNTFQCPWEIKTGPLCLLLCSPSSFKASLAIIIFKLVVAFVELLALKSFVKRAFLMCSSFFRRETQCARDLALSQMRRVRARRDDWRHGNCDSSINNLSTILFPS